MDRAYIGNNFHNLMLDMGENYYLTQPDGEIYTGKISLTTATASSYMLAEREYLMKGTATFPDVDSQVNFRGCYFSREINPNITYILVSTIPKDTTPYVADIYAIQCNTTVSLAIIKQITNEKMDTVDIPEIYAEDILVYWDSTLQKQRRSSDGNFDQTLFNMQIPASYTITQDELVLRKVFKYNEKTQQNEWLEEQFRVESIDLAMTTVDSDGNLHGIIDVQMSLDTR